MKRTTSGFAGRASGLDEGRCDLRWLRGGGLCLLAVVTLLLGGENWVFGAEAAPDFNRDVRPILSDKCYYCHGPDEEKRKGELRLDTPEGAAKVFDRMHWEKSALIDRITTTDRDDLMPPPDSNIGKSLSPKEVETLKAWVRAGAKYEKHWAFVAPNRPRLPQGVSGHPVDVMVRERLKKEGLAAGGAREARREVLARRLYLDLTGLPPSPAEVSAFVEDSRTDAYSRLVDRVLASPHYGERMALMWMDLARYGDSSVYHADGPREMWGWRDWVIDAFNRNMRYDRFTVEQLAGDLLPDAGLSQRIATGFNRNHATTDEGGVIAEEFRVDYVVDRVKTVSNVWLGLSLECAQCHDHKYDPISQNDYYRFYAYFNNTKDPGMQTRNGNTAPLVEIPDPEAETKRRVAREAREAAQGALQKAVVSKEKNPAFIKWRAGAPVGVAFPLEGIILQIPCREADKAQLVSALEGYSGNTRGVGLGTVDRKSGVPALSFKGNAGAVFEEGIQLDGASPFTLGAWVKLSDQGATGSILTRMVAGGNSRGFDGGFEKGRPGLHLVHQWAGDALKVYAKQPLSKGEWHYVSVSYDGSRKALGVQVAVDGRVVELASAEADSLKGSAETDAPMVLAGRQDGSRFKGELSDVVVWGRRLDTSELVRAMDGDLVEALRAVPMEARSGSQNRALLAAYALGVDRTDSGLRVALAKALDQEIKLAKGLSSVMVMEDLPATQMRSTFVLNRGQYDAPMKDREVRPGVPAVMPPLAEGASENRLGMAQWLVSREHPLTARVTVNRIWQMIFGEGLVRTSEDFGLQGEMPSHPELLDWLAVEFMESGWDVKGLIRTLVMSATYRQDSALTKELRERDPENRLLARGPRFRLQGEFIRDGALLSAGLLNPKVGGPSVKPYQPKGVWEEVALDTNLSKFVPDSGDKLYRRSMYTYWKRSSPHPALVTFDATTREKCTGRRSRTNTPLQALVTLNDPQFVEAARGLAQRVLMESKPSGAERVATMVRMVFGRRATEREVSLLSALAQRAKEGFAASPESAAKLLTVGESLRAEGISVEEHAAWTVVANAVLNLDEFLVKQ